MPDEPKVLTPPPVVTPVATPPAAAPATAPPAITAAQLLEALKQLPEDQRPYMNKAEIVEHNQIARAARDELAELKKEQGQQPPAVLPPKTGDERMDAHAQAIADLSAENKQVKLQLAISTSGKKLEPDQLVAIEALAVAQKPDNYDEWLAKTLPMFASKAPPDPAPANGVAGNTVPAVAGEIVPPVAAPAAKPLAVAMPATAPHASAYALPENPNQADLATIGAMTREKRQEYVNGWLAKGGTRNPMRSGNR